MNQPVKPKKPLNVAVIGAGYFSQFHLDAWRRLAGIRLATIIEQDAAKRSELATEFPQVKCVASVNEAFSQSSAVDIIDIITPPATHATLIKQLSHLTNALLICQKPFCTSPAEAKRVTHLAAQRKKKLVVHENFRFQPWYAQIKSMLDSGELGTVLQATYKLRPGDGQGANAYLDRQPYFRKMERFLIHETGIHWVDTFRYLFGEPQHLYADLRRINPHIKGEDAGTFTFHYDGGLRVTFDGNRHLDHSAANRRLTMGEMLIEGSLASLQLTGDGELKLRQFNEHIVQTINYSFNDQGFGGDCVYRLNRHIVEHLQTGTPLQNCAAEYMQNIRLEELIYQSAQNGRLLPCRPEEYP